MWCDVDNGNDGDDLDGYGDRVVIMMMTIIQFTYCLFTYKLTAQRPIKKWSTSK
jgi:hypothetical protein